LIWIKAAAAALPRMERRWLAPAPQKSREMIMKGLSSLRTALLAATASVLAAGAQAGPMPTNVAAMKSMVDQATTQVQWRGGFRGGGFGYRGVGFRGGGWGVRGGGWRGGGYGWRGGGWRGGGWGYRGLGYGVAAGALVGGAIASSAYYGGYGGYYGGGYGGYGYPSYSYAAVPYYGYGGGYGYGSYCPPYRGGYTAGYYGW
jgi:hypothetical protein